MRFRAIVVLLLCVPAFAKSPKYQKPSVSVPQNWQTPAPWQQALPLDSLPKGMWWAFFGDAELNQYEQRAMVSNQTLQAAIARLSEARASARVTAAGLYPELDAGARATRERLSGTGR